MNNKTFKASELKFSNRCLTKRNADILTEVESEKGESYIIASIIKESLRKFSTPGEKYSIDTLKEYILSAIEEKSLFFPSQAAKDASVEKLVFCINRYFVEEYERHFKNKYSFEAYPAERTVHCFGINVSVTPDIVFYDSNKVTVVKYKYSKPNIAVTSSKPDAGANTSLELYAMLLYGRQCAEEIGLTDTVEISAEYYFLQKPDDDFKNDKMAATYFSKTKCGNIGLSERILSFDTAAMVAMPDWDASFAAQFDSFVKGSDCKGTEHCSTCPLSNICNFRELPERAVVEKKKKSIKDLRLNKVQSSAISFKRGIARINAGAGSGKTLVTALRAVNLMKEEGVNPKNILLVTFTDAGAKEMKERIEAYSKEFDVPYDVANLNVTTFNAFAYGIIKKEFLKLGFTKAPTVIDNVEKSVIVADILNSHPQITGLDYVNFDMEMYKAAGAVAMTKHIFELIKLNNYSNIPSDIDEIIKKSKYSVKEETISEIFPLFDEYTRMLKAENLIDYSDQELLMFELFDMEPNYIEKFGFKHIFVDEFQDSSEDQMRLIKKLVTTKSFESLMVVGDDSQAIYSFRDTSPKNIITFFDAINEEEDNFQIRYFDDEEMYDFYLLENYRSTPEIIDFANKLNDINLNKVNKTLTATNISNGICPKAISFNNRIEEMAFVADEIEKKIVAGRRPEEICFIAATRNELIEMQNLLENKNIRTLMLNPEYVLENNRVRALIALSKAFLNPDLTANIMDYLNTFYDGKFFDMDDAEVKGAIEKIRVAMYTLSAADDSVKFNSLKKYAEAISGNDELYLDFCTKLFAKNDFDKVLKYINGFERFGASVTYKRIESYTGAVLLTTAHSSKGLEWPVVFNSISKYHSAEFKSDEEEEEKRRLFFVSVTRAREELMVTGTSVAYKKTVKDPSSKTNVSVPVANIFMSNAQSILTAHPNANIVA